MPEDINDYLNVPDAVLAMYGDLMTGWESLEYEISQLTYQEFNSWALMNREPVW